MVVPMCLSLEIRQIETFLRTQRCRAKWQESSDEEREGNLGR